MSIRRFTWQDLLTLFRYRKDVLSLDNGLTLTRGNPTGISATMVRLQPLRDTFTGVIPAQDEKPPLVGQVIYTHGARAAHISYVLPASRCGEPELVELLESLCSQAGEWGALRVLAQVDESDSAFEALRRAGFSVYAWQKVYQISAQKVGSRRRDLWQLVSSADDGAVRSLYQTLVPPLVQSAEPPPTPPLEGLVYRRGDTLLAYIEGLQGPRGMLLQPVIHPEAGDLTALLNDLPHHLPSLMGRPVYVVVRSYQNWLEAALEPLQPKEATPRLALMVKHLTAGQRAYALNGRRATNENRQAEPTAPIANTNGTAHAASTPPDQP